MKTYTIIFTILLSLFTIMSCKNDDDTPTQQPEPHPIEGKWSLVQLTGGWNPREFAIGDIVWNFESDETMFIDIREGVEPSPSDVFTPSAFGINYTYEVNDSESVLILISDNYQDHPLSIPYTLENETLKFITNESADGMSYHFVKLPD